MPSVVIDASTLVGALLKADSIPERALIFARTHDVLCMSPDAAREIAEVFARPKFKAVQTSGRAALILEIVMSAAAWHDPTVKVTDCRDAKDNKYLELALAAGADAIVSSDADLLDLSPWRGIAIIRPADYVARFERPGAGV